ncbi:phosphosulfolactate synthase [Paenibacillus rhizovicinus]|uniref:Phosphosulfolactate synthase n=1 Tax=Paenibacillus rhizovicinus TaxID=2704463 RepID=A0A6C0P0Q2_9BACL|nr:phosphosulfolactate synthase [Paenibacillus rhizovicinus]QHW30292.1 phosphosulfolactate synthase [Paenibacillus rhizovicinus]
MKTISQAAWPAALQDPSGQREMSGRAGNEPESEISTRRGQTMVIDKGLGRHAFSDLMETAAGYIDCVKFGFGTAPLYPTDLLLAKIELAKRCGLTVMPGGTLLETAVQQNVVPAFFRTVCRMGFNGIEVSDGTIELSRMLRTELIHEGIRNGLKVVTEYGKKLSGSLVDANELLLTAEADWKAGAHMVTIEARESGMDVGLFDRNGDCAQSVLDSVSHTLGDISRIMWETPLKQQQVQMLKTFGAEANLGNIQPSEVLALETMRRGLRSDTFYFGERVEPFVYMI